MTSGRGWTIWLTGLPASGKTALARALHATLAERGVTAVILDSDELRPLLSPTGGYGEAARGQFYSRLIDLADLLSGYGANLLIAATANRAAYRDAARERLAPFAEVWVQCALEICRARDPKGLYAAADSGAISELPGVDAPYEPPARAEIAVDTTRRTVAESAATILAALPLLRRTLPATASPHE